MQLRNTTTRWGWPVSSTALLALGVVLAIPVRAAPASYVGDPAASALTFRFTQAGAQNGGRFRSFNVTLSLDPAQFSGGKLDVTVDVSSLDTADKDRDGMLRGADMLDVAKYPQAHFSATALRAVDATHFQATGQLTLRNVARPLTVPFTFVPAKNAGPQGTASMTGQVVIKRLDFGVGQGDWKSTEWVGNDVTVSFTLRLHQP